MLQNKYLWSNLLKMVLPQVNLWISFMKMIYEKCINKYIKHIVTHKIFSMKHILHYLELYLYLILIYICYLFMIDVTFTINIHTSSCSASSWESLWGRIKKKMIKKTVMHGTMEHNAVELLYANVLYEPPIHEYIYYDRGDCIIHICLYVYMLVCSATLLYIDHHHSF